MHRATSRLPRLATLVVATGLALSLLPAATASPTAPSTGSDPSSTEPSARTTSRVTRWVPVGGVTFNDPMVRSRQRVIIGKIIKAINATPRGERIRIATWNFDDRNTADALIRAHKRGVSVQVMASAQVVAPSFYRLRRTLRTRPIAKDPSMRSFARKCGASCRGRRGTGIMHTKFYLFSRIGKVRKISMFGSANLTAPAANRQWNDLITVTHSRRLFDELNRTFKQLKADRFVRPTPFRIYDTPNKRFRVILFPTTNTNRNPILNAFRAVKCRGATDGAGNAIGRTKIRIGIAGWFDTYGEQIAQQVRALWDRGCDIKIVNTLTGRGINRALRSTGGRGPVPNREVTIDSDYDEIPEKYLHLKYFTINGVYNNQTDAKVVFTGSANWTRRSLRSDELIVRVQGKDRWVTRYENLVDSLYDSPWAHARSTSPALARGGTATTGTNGRSATPQVPHWFEIN